jgi:Delta7-sterol 5-desaturase
MFYYIWKYLILGEELSDFLDAASPIANYIYFSNFVIFLLVTIGLDRARSSKRFYKFFYCQISMCSEEYLDAIHVTIVNFAQSLALMIYVIPYLMYYQIVTTTYQSVGWEFVKFGILILLTDLMFYWVHRLMHHPKIYFSVHEMHHQHIATSVWSSFYFSKSELILNWMFVVMLPLCLFSIHYHTFNLYLIVISLSLVKSHSGINIGEIYTSSYHDIHHVKFNLNYGSSLAIWDKLFGTYAKLTYWTTVQKS